MTGLIAWISNYGQMVLYFGQILYWAILCWAALWATLILRRYVNAKVARIEMKMAEASAPAAAPASASTDISIDEFVE